VPFQYEVLRNGSLVYTRVSGAMTHDEALAHHRALAADPAISPGFSEILDSRRATRAEISADTMRALAELDRELGAKMVGCRVAVVAGEVLSFRLQHAFPRDAPRRVIMFSDIETAARWLGIEDLQEVLGQG